VTAYDLENTYLFLDGVGGVKSAPGGEAFWRSVGDNPDAGGTLVIVSQGEGDWDSWEMHPAGDEVLVLLEGSLSIMLELRDGQTREHSLTAGGTLVVPAGAWHRFVGQRGVRMLFITYGAGTQHRPVAA
jgi:mannose-6-phosphate isomerase-like protein (cupin superfamily)